MKTIAHAEAYLGQFIQTSLVPGHLFLKRTRSFLNLLGNPQNKLRVIHVAGTSGKSSTAYFISALLSGQGFKTGLYLSPHLFDIRERMQINNQLPSKKDFIDYVKKLKPYIEHMKTCPYGQPSYFEITVVMAYLFFYEQQVDYAVIETGLGGITDPTNSVDSPDKVCALTKIGFDHTDILGKTIQKIALNKAGIIQKGNHVFSFFQSDEITDVYRTEAKKKNAHLHIIKPEKTYHIQHMSEKGSVVQFLSEPVQGEVYETVLPGGFQIENLALGLQVMNYLSTRDTWRVKKKNLRHTIETVQMPGRFQMINKTRIPFLIDAAHNEQKMKAFIHNLVQLYPNKKYLFLIAIKQGKDYKAMIRQIAKVADHIVITRFLKENQDVVHMSVAPEDISYELNKQGFTSYEIREDAQKALTHCLIQPHFLTIVTGSLYFVGDVYERYYSF